MKNEKPKTKIGGGKMVVYNIGEIKEFLDKDWRKNYYAITARCLAETFFLQEPTPSITYKCVRCGRVVLTTSDIIKFSEGKLEEIQKAKFTNGLKIGRGGMLICHECFKEIKPTLKFYHSEETRRKVLRSIRLKIVETRSYKNARAKAYRVLEKFLKEGVFRYKVRENNQNLYFF
jgi:DNA-directed RNA polymerase subunit RPC12/RpoP